MEIEIFLPLLNFNICFWVNTIKDSFYKNKIDYFYKLNCVVNIVDSNKIFYLVIVAKKDIFTFTMLSIDYFPYKYSLKIDNLEDNYLCKRKKL